MREEIQVRVIQVRVNDQSVTVTTDTSVAVAIALTEKTCRTSVSGERRAPLCGMGICFECRATVNGTPHTRTCQLLCEPAMEIRTT
jgi:sarcosine oxidase subunit alpha